MIDSIENYLDPEALSLYKRYETETESGVQGFYDVDEYVTIIGVLMGYEKFSEAAQLLRLARERYPYAVELKLKQAEMNLESGFSEQALKQVVEVEEVEPYLFEVHLIKGHILKELLRFPEALKCFEKARKAGAEDVDVEMGLASVEAKAGNMEKAWRHTQGFIGFDSDTVETGNRYIDLAVETGHLPEAMEQMRKLLKDNPYRVLYWKMLSELAEEADCYEQALEAEEFVLAIKSDDREALMRKFRLLEFVDADEENMDFYFRLEEIFTDLQDLLPLWLRITQAFEYQEKWEKAEEYYNKLVSFPETGRYALFRLGVMRHFAHDLEGALRYFKQALTCEDPTDRKVQNTAMIFRGMARNMRYRGEIEKALLYGRLACETDPENRFHVYSLVEDACDFERIADGLETVGALYAENHHERPWLALAMGALYWAKGDLDKAYLYFVEAFTGEASKVMLCDADMRFNACFDKNDELLRLRNTFEPPFNPEAEPEDGEDDEPFAFFGPEE